MADRRPGRRWEALPETREALDELDPPVDAQGILARLRRLAGRAQAVVPDLVGVSVCPFVEDLTFTLVSSTESVAVLDGVQYVAGGPCVDGAHEARVRAYHEDDVLDEERWWLFAQATAAHQVRSTLTLPVGSEHMVTGTVNLYAGSTDAFTGHHEELAAIFGGWAGGVVANADLSFSTRDEARAAPERARERMVVDVAVGIVSAELDVDVDTAEARLHDAAARAGVTVGQLARAVLRTRDLREE